MAHFFKKYNKSSFLKVFTTASAAATGVSTLTTATTPDSKTPLTASLHFTTAKATMTSSPWLTSTLWPRLLPSGTRSRSQTIKGVDRQALRE